MKFTKKLLITFALVIVTLSAVACGGLTMPSTSAQIIGNGGNSVMKGQYLYYTNGFVSKDTITLSNRKDDNYVNGGLYVTEMNADGSIKRNDDGGLSYNKRLLGYITGFENSDLRIYGDYLYYTTPNRGKTAGEAPTVTSNLVDFWRIKLNGEDNKKLYTSANEVDKLTYNYYMSGKETIFVILDGTDLSTVKCTNKGIGSVNKLQKGVSAIAMPNIIDNPSADTSSYKDIFFAQELSDTDKEQVERGNKLMRLDAKTGKVTELVKNNLTYTPKTVMNGHLYTDRSETSGMAGTISGTYLYKCAISEFDNITYKFDRVTATSYANSYVLESSTLDGIDGLLVVTSRNTTCILQGGSLDKEVEVLPTAMTVLGIRSSTVYYTDSDAKVLYRMDLKPIDGVFTPEVIYDSTKVFEGEPKELVAKLVNKTVDFDGKYVYLYITEHNEDSTLYTYRIDTTEKSAGHYNYEFIGTYAKDDKPIEKDDKK